MRQVLLRESRPDKRAEIHHSGPLLSEEGACFGYGAAIASVLFAIMAVFITWYLTRIIRAEERGA